MPLFRIVSGAISSELVLPLPFEMDLIPADHSLKKTIVQQHRVETLHYKQKYADTKRSTLADVTRDRGQSSSEIIQQLKSLIAHWAACFDSE